jgi:FkbM family methyltransferase
MSQVLRSLSYLAQRYVLRRQTLSARVPGLELCLLVHATDVHGRHVFKYGRHEAHLTRFVRERVVLQPGDVALDVGANIGWYSLILQRQAAPGAEVFAFEPEPANFTLLQRNVENNAALCVRPLRLAVGDREGRARLHLYSAGNRGRHSLLPLHAGSTIEVEVTTLDGFWERHGLGDRVPRFVKIDVEGAEPVVLRGARRVLARCPTVATEWAPAYMRKGGQEPEALLDLMRDLGFAPLVVTAEGARPVARDVLLGSDARRDLVWQRAAR